MIILIILIVSLASLLTWAWVKGIDDMKDNHPDYKGEDFLELGKAPWEDDEWDNNQHNEDV